jgi:hypothetical protein
MTTRALLLLLTAALMPGMAAAQRAPAANHRPPPTVTPEAAHVARYGHSGLAGVTTHADSVAVIAFVHTLQAAVARDDRRAVARMIRFPLTAWDGRRSRPVRNAAEMAALYPRVFSPGLRRDIAAVTVDSLFSNWQGVMFASGRVWFDRDQAGRLAIYCINPPIGVSLARHRPARRHRARRHRDERPA